jgi:Peptidase A4 family
LRELRGRDSKRGGRLGLASLLVFAAVLLGAPAALANTTKSTNWAGYAIHRAGVSFHQVSATWIQPSATCTSGHASYSAMWVGLGGYKPTSDALEQIGTEVDCGAGGRVLSSAWYELVPAPSKTISFAVHPGDAIHASVTVTGHQVVVELDNLTRHHTFRKTLYTPSIDISSAEWIVEAPSECMSQYACQALPLADFGSVSFESATAVTTNGAVGSIAGSGWGRTKIKLTPGSQRFIVARGASATAGTAAPSALRGGGRAFDVTYATAPVQPSPQLARDARVRAGYIQH